MSSEEIKIEVAEIGDLTEDKKLKDSGDSTTPDTKKNAVQETEPKDATESTQNGQVEDEKQKTEPEKSEAAEPVEKVEESEKLDNTEPVEPENLAADVVEEKNDDSSNLNEPQILDQPEQDVKTARSNISDNEISEEIQANDAVQPDETEDDPNKEINQEVNESSKSDENLDSSKDAVQAEILVNAEDSKPISKDSSREEKIEDVKPEDSVQKDEVSKKAGVRDYLNREVAPILQSALIQLAQDQPEGSLDYLINYLAEAKKSRDIRSHGSPV